MRWFGLYEVQQVHNNGKYQLSELDGTILRPPVAGKRIKIFKKRNNAETCIEVTNSNTIEEAERSKEVGLNENESGLELVIELGEGNKDTMDNEESHGTDNSSTC